MSSLRHGVLTLFLLAGACTSAGPARVAGAPDTVRVGAYYALGVGPVMLAQAEGYFDSVGISVELLQLGSWEGRMAALLTGEIDVSAGSVTLSDLASARRGSPVRTVADRGILEPGACAYVGLALRPGLDTLGAGRRVRRVSSTREGPGLWLVDAAVTATGGSWDSLDLVALQSPARLPALANGQLDLIQVEEPHLSAAARAGTLWRDGAQVLPGIQWAHLRFGERLLGPDRDVGIRFLAAYRRGIQQFALGKTPRNVAVLAAGLGFEPAEVEATCWPVIRPDGRINLAAVMDYAAWAMRRGLLDQAPTPDQFWDSTLVAASDSVLRLHFTPSR